MSYSIWASFFNQVEVKPKPITLCKHGFFCTLSNLQVITRNSDWFIVLFAPVVIGQSNHFGIVFRQSFENRSTIMLTATAQGSLRNASTTP